MTRGEGCGLRGLVLRATAIASCMLVAGCRCVGPDYVPPETPMPAAFLEEPGCAASRPSVARGAPWWHAVEDPTLHQLIDDASARSYDLRIVVARVDEVRALRAEARSRLFPFVDATASAHRQQDSGNSLFFTEPILYNQFRAGFDAGWEVDLWGRVRREVEAATADQRAAEALLADTMRIVASQVAAEYFDLRGAESELEVARRNIDSQRETVELTQNLVEAGLGNEADVARARGLMRETESLVPLLEARIAGGAHRLAVLTGGDARDVRARLAAGKGLPQTPAEPELGVPSDLLAARPDIRGAERELAAATARIGVAVADLFPRVTLTGRFGLDSTEAGTLFEADSISFGVGPGVRWPVLDFGAVRSRIRAQGARQRAALARYEQVVAQALMEVETAIASLAARRRSRDSLAAAVTENRESLRLIDARFREGAVSFLEVLDAQRRLLLVEGALARAETLLLLDFVALNRALG